MVEEFPLLVLLLSTLDIPPTLGASRRKVQELAVLALCQLGSVSHQSNPYNMELGGIFHSCSTEEMEQDKESAP